MKEHALKTYYDLFGGVDTIIIILLLVRSHLSVGNIVLDNINITLYIVI